jgi:hypothetical protein
VQKRDAVGLYELGEATARVARGGECSESAPRDDDDGSSAKAINNTWSAVVVLGIAIGESGGLREQGEKGDRRERGQGEHK